MKRPQLQAGFPGRILDAERNGQDNLHDLWNVPRLQLRAARLVSEGDLLAVSVKRQPPEGQHILVAIDDLASINAGAYCSVPGATDVALSNRRRHMPIGCALRVGLPAASGNKRRTGEQRKC